MKLDLVKGSFTQTEAVDLLTRLVHVKIRFHEDKIEKSHNEEDIKMRETRIKELQRDFFEAKKSILANHDSCSMQAMIEIH
jgi:hypothetical protein